jgi:hypothetical protein
MQIVQAGAHQLIALELDPESLRQVVTEAGLECEVGETSRALVLELSAPDREGPFLLFDASDPANTGWFSRCQFYVDGKTGAVMQTPFTVANQREPNGRPSPRALTLQIRKELPPHFKLPGRQAVSERVVYSVLYNFLQALLEVGVGLCGPGAVKALAGRVDPLRPAP